MRHCLNLYNDIASLLMCYMKKNCSSCKNKCDAFDSSKESIKKHLMVKDSRIFDLIIFFEYFSPNTSSNLSDRLDGKMSDKVLGKMLNCAFKKDKNYTFTSTGITKETLSEYSLNGEDIYSSCKRLVCNVAPKDNSNKLTALLRHIRNSIAHGRYFVLKSGSYYKFLFEDGNDKNITFRMCINHSTLRKWKEILISSINGDLK